MIKSLDISHNNSPTLVLNDLRQALNNSRFPLAFFLIGTKPQLTSDKLCSSIRLFNRIHPFNIRLVYAFTVMIQEEFDVRSQVPW